MSRAAATAGALLLAPFLAGGCGDPSQRAADDYVAAMQPVLARNMDLTREFVDVATEVKKGEASARAVARRFESSLVPQATALRDAVVAIQPEDPELAATHALLAEAWTGRVAVYAELHRAWGAGELEAFDAATRTNLDLKDSEQQYFTQANAWLEERGQRLDPYP